MEYGTPVKLQDGRYFIRITGADKGRVLKQINGAEVQESNCFKIPVSLSDFDEEILNQAEKCSEEWFGGKKFDREILKNAYDSSVAAGIFEAPLAKKAGSVIAKVFDKDRKEISPEVLVPGTQCDILVELSGLWFVKKSFGPVWRVIQVRLKKESTFPSSYMFKDDEHSDGDDEYCM